MNASILFDILKQAKLDCVSRIIKHGSANEHDEVLAEERVYEVLSEVEREFIDQIDEDLVDMARIVGQEKLPLLHDKLLIPTKDVDGIIEGGQSTVQEETAQ